MYLAGHLLASIALAKIVHKPLGVKFLPLAMIAMAVNLIDADHLIYYHLDDGTANSFQLHILHQIWAFLGLAVCLLALILKPHQNFIFGILFALFLHYGLDLLGNLFTYKLEAIIGFEVLCLATLLVLFRKDEKRLKYGLFFVGLWLFCNAVLGFQTFILHWEPHLTRGIYLTAVTLNVLAVLAFWKIFVKNGSYNIS